MCHAKTVLNSMVLDGILKHYCSVIYILHHLLISIQVCIGILSNSISSDESNQDTKIRSKTLKLLCTMNPAFCKSLRSEAISRCKLPGLTIELSVSSETHGKQD